MLLQKSPDAHTGELSLAPAGPQHPQRLRVCIVHSLNYTVTLWRGMGFIHKDRDLLLHHC